MVKRCHLAKDLPEGRRIIKLFHRRRTSNRGGNGLTSVRESLVSVRGGGFIACCAKVLSSVWTRPESSSELFAIIGWLAIWFRSWVRLFSTIWYMELRSWRKVSLKNNRKERKLRSANITRNQNTARQLKP